jgi:(1->4)-alpha-D-glucan 1-alpha-D-glucosylmutase
VIPRATYRLQFHRGFTFADAAAILPYLARLGVSHVYASPIFTARPGSTHGYDVIDPTAINPELGGEDGYAAFVAALAAHGLALMQDIVPNHMAVLAAQNPWWHDVLKHGRASRHADWFDIEWTPASEELRDKVLLPVLESPYGDALARGVIVAAFDADRGTFVLRVGDATLPLDPREAARAIDALPRPGEDAATLVGWQALAAAMASLPATSDASDAARRTRAARTATLEASLAELCAREPAVRAAIERRVARLNGTPGDDASFDALHGLLKAQPYRLAYWRVAGDEINYRRFFDVNALAALRMERDDVFEATHARILAMVARGEVAALRVDHPDGLADPGAYFARLQRAVRPPAEATHAGVHTSTGRPLPIYLVVEKILAEDEALPGSWPVHGTTGYDFAALTHALFVDGASAARFERLYRAFTRADVTFADVAVRARRAAMRSALASDVVTLATRLTRLAKADRHTSDHTYLGLHEAIVDIAAHFPVYRTYAGDGGASAVDRAVVDTALAGATRHRITGRAACDFVAATLVDPLPADTARRALAHAFVTRFQQFTPPVMAKGVEDTAFYVYNRLVSLNDVGSDPRRFGVSARAWHAAMAARARRWPHALLASTTHDSKRAEDVRARLAALAGMPAEWRLALRRWRRLNAHHKRHVDDHMAPSASDEYLLYQTLLGAWPLALPDAPARDAWRERVQRFMLKAAREAKLHTSWIHPHAGYEDALTRFIDAILDPASGAAFLEDFVPAQARLARFGFCNGLAQTLLKLAAPGVPDFYQGSELWDLRLVDPDNRGPVDFGAREAALADVQSIDLDTPGAPARVRALCDTLDDGRAKLHVIARALAMRARKPDLFAGGGYAPLRATGARAAHVVAFTRTLGDEALIAIVPRLVVRLLDGHADRLPLGEDVWGDTTLALPGAWRRWRNALTGVSLTLDAAPQALLADVLADFPVALLEAA